MIKKNPHKREKNKSSKLNLEDFTEGTWTTGHYDSYTKVRDPKSGKEFYEKREKPISLNAICIECGYHARYNSSTLISGTKCPRCQITLVNIGKNLRIPKKKKKKQFLKDLKKLLSDRKQLEFRSDRKQFYNEKLRRW